MDSRFNAVELDLQRRRRIADEDDRVSADKELYQAILVRRVMEREADKKRQKNGTEANEHQKKLLLALNHFNENYISSQYKCTGLSSLALDEFQAIEVAFPEAKYKPAFNHYRTWNNFNAQLHDKAQLEYVYALSSLKTFLDARQDLNKSDSQDLQCRLYREGKKVYEAIDNAPKDGSEAQYILLRKILISTQIGIERPGNPTNKDIFETLTKNVRGDWSFGTMLWGAMKMFAGTLSLAFSLTCLGVSILSPIFVIPAVAYGALGIWALYSGVSTIKNEVKEKKEMAIPTVANACSLFHKEWKKKDSEPQLESTMFNRPVAVM